MPVKLTADAVNETPNEVFLEWEAPVRVFIKRDEKYTRTVIWILLAIGLVLVFFKEFLLYAVFLSLAFVSFVLRTVPPQSVGHKITEHGLTSGNHSYLWKELRDFWFTEKGDFWILNVDTNLRFPPRLFLIVPKKDKNLTQEKLIATLSKFIAYREIPQENFVDRVFDAVSQKFNLS